LKYDQKSTLGKVQEEVSAVGQTIKEGAQNLSKKVAGTGDDKY
jgi:hypothetical protein